MLYAFRDLDDPTDSWFGDKDALPESAYETWTHRLDAGTSQSPFDGHQLEFRHGQLPDDGNPAPMRSFTNVPVHGQLQGVQVHVDVARILFPGHS